MIDVSDYGEMRLMQRTNSGDPPPFSQLWDEAVSVGGPNISGTARYHPIEEIILIENGGTLVNALLPENEELNTDHLKECTKCGHPYDPADSDNCPWCN